MTFITIIVEVEIFGGNFKLAKIVSFPISRQSSTMLVIVPANLNFRIKNDQLYAGDVIVDCIYKKSDLS